MALADLGAGTGGMWTRQQALACVTPGALRAQLAAGTWRTTWPGVLCDGGIELDPLSWTWAAVLASLPRGCSVPRLDVAACARSAARVLGIPLIDDHDPATGARDHVHHDVAVQRHVGDLASRPISPSSRCSTCTGDSSPCSWRTSSSSTDSSSPTTCAPSRTWPAC